VREGENAPAEVAGGDADEGVVGVFPGKDATGGGSGAKKADEATQDPERGEVAYEGRAKGAPDREAGAKIAGPVGEVAGKEVYVRDRRALEPEEARDLIGAIAASVAGGLGEAAC
jgi:hypothetical protein